MTTPPIAVLIAQLEALDVQVFIEGEDSPAQDTLRLRCTAPAGILTPELRQTLADRKTELIAYFREKGQGRRERDASRELPSVSRSTVDCPGSAPRSRFALSFAQQRLWFLYQLAPDNPFYNVPAAIRLTGNLDRTALERSFATIVGRHAALRTRFTTVAGQPVQVVEPQVAVEFTRVNLQTVAVADRDRVRQQLATAEAQRPFHLTTDRLLRVTLLEFAATESVLLLTLHHIVADGWSIGVLFRELASCYAAFVEGRSPVLPPLPMQYTDFADWQRHALQGAVLAPQLTYWRRQLQDLPVLQLPSDRPRPAVQTYRGATCPLELSPTLTRALADLSQQSGASLFMILLAAFQTLLYRYTGQDDLAIGAPIANRHRSEWEGLIGFFVNTLVLRSDLSGNPTFRELLERVRQVAIAAYEHQDLPFEHLVADLDPDRDLSRNPLFQVAFALQNAPMQVLELPSLTLEPAPFESGSTRFDLEVHLWEPAHGLRSLWKSHAGLSGFISYSTDLFDRDRIERLIGHFQTLLAGIVADPDAHLTDLPLLTATESQQIRAWSQPDSQTTRDDRCFHHSFEDQVRSDPTAIALVTEQGPLTYAELNQKADRLAQTLRQWGVQSNSLVGLCVDRSADLVIGMLGILKAGGAYVPLDPNYPSDRLHFMLTDTQVTILLTQSWLVASLPSSSATQLCLDHFDRPLPAAPAPQSAGHSTTPDHLAYVIYTSGSTGTPKGGLLTHRGLSNVVVAQQQCFHLSRRSRVLQFSSLSFDASIFEIALALGCGGTLYIPPQSAQLPGMELVQFLQANAISHALLTPAVLAVLPAADLPDLQVLITGGEACSRPVLDRWSGDRHFFNAYGPTETTIWATLAKLSPGDPPSTIGRPIRNTQVLILDANLNPVPAGIPGELYIGGAGIAQGYLNRPDLTAERFVSSPPFLLPRLYKTGDRAQYHPDGTIEFLGRLDHQIKIRGFRVELGEIEATLQRHPAIREVVTIATTDPLNETRLTTYFSLNPDYLQQQSRLQPLQTQHIQYWQTLYNQTYQSPLPSTPTFNTTGWNSSYTGQPIPADQMQEWVRDRVQQILAFKPKRVLEIGCGTGLLLFQIAPHCQQYVGTDFSEVSLQAIQPQLTSLHLTHVELLHRPATDFEGIDLKSFDVVILNSIVQYFPTVDYLLQVLAGAMQTVATGGVLFIGDVRSLPLLSAFHAWVQFCQAADHLERSQLQQLVARSQFEEPELAIAPAFFESLRDRFSQIQQVQIRLTRGHSENEMTQFRYHVLLHVGESTPPHIFDTRFLNPESLLNTQSPPILADVERAKEANSNPNSRHSIQNYDWRLNPITIAHIQQHLLETEPDILLVTNITNSRVSRAVTVAQWLDKSVAPKTVGQMRELLHAAEPSGITPQAWWDLEAQLPYTVEITWSTPTDSGNYDVRFLRQGGNVTIAASASRPPASGTHHANHPLQAIVSRHLIPELRHFLRQALPEYMVPAAFVPLAALPLTASGKIDRASLATRSRCGESIQPARAAIAPTTPTAAMLMEIWQELLRLHSITMHDNFFELGGHSLLATQMTSRVRDAFGLELPLQSVFQAPTIAQLAPILETLRQTTASPTMPPLVRLDRSAHRRQRPRSVAAAVSPEIQPRTAQIQNHLGIPASAASTARSPLIPLTLGDRQQPFFCVHPMFGVVFPYLELAHQLGSHRSFYGLQPFGLDGKSPPLNRIEAIAAYYIQAIQTLQPHGPYFLGGWSFGGLVAFEMAQQLTQARQQMALLALLDTPAPCYRPSFYQSLKFLLGTALWSTLPFLLDFGALATQQMQSRNSWFARRQWSAIVRLIPEESRLQLLDESTIHSLLPIVVAHAQAVHHYQPRPYRHRITLFQAMEQSEAIGQDGALGWRELAHEVDSHAIPGNHLSLLKHPNVQVLAQQLGRYL